MQKTHETTDFQEKKFPLVLVLDGVSGPANVGSLFRLADAFNVEKIIFCGTELHLKSNRLKRTARSTVKNVIFEEHDNSEVVCRNLQESGYSIMALEIAAESVPLEEEKYDTYNKIALVLGNENSGITSNILTMADKLLHINMFGKNSSMNVTHAAGIALFEITKSLHPVR
ncbi:TrmH family RNA methyltransferase [Salinimicrobium oceani]|uniref:TrmH family RNA methyltransferase n=1 Tax=Salinimicrobium oceani TaxID=2722702 RepID=A0ABX1CYR0_9FLAO|nr:TrmH family RNA methyltransferase [Salinimicrobium oceani]NJW53406.1 TrmH family RNA methyltransferase [Salinimicrobium oceani]